MIISHTNRYVFIEVPRTASTAIAEELVESYEGEFLVPKHARYDQFLKQASSVEKDYRVFSCIRNPLDSVVSKYFKYKTDHKNKYTGGRVTSRRQLKKYQYVSTSNADFGAYLQRFYRFPYCDWSVLDHHKFDCVLRFEHLQHDFDSLLQFLNLKKVRDLPLVNTTSERERNYLSYYADAKTIAHAKWVFGPFMRELGYCFPKQWEAYSEFPLAELGYAFSKSLRRCYWQYVSRGTLEAKQRGSSPDHCNCSR